MTGTQPARGASIRQTLSSFHISPFKKGSFLIMELWRIAPVDQCEHNKKRINWFLQHVNSLKWFLQHENSLKWQLPLQTKNEQYVFILCFLYLHHFLHSSSFNIRLNSVGIFEGSKTLSLSLHVFTFVCINLRRFMLGRKTHSRPGGCARGFVKLLKYIIMMGDRAGLSWDNYHMPGLEKVGRVQF